MKVLLQDKTTGLFFISQGCWTGAREDARDFKTSASAIWTAQHYNLQEAAVVYAFGSASNDVHITIREEMLPDRGGPVRTTGRGGAKGRQGPGIKRDRQQRTGPAPDVRREEGGRESAEV
jgi:hypothetical protein